MSEEIRVEVAVIAWFYPSKDIVKAERERALAQFGDDLFAVYAGIQDDGDVGFVAFVGPNAALDMAEAAWVPQEGAERGRLRDDIAAALARRYMFGRPSSFGLGASTMDPNGGI